MTKGSSRFLCRLIVRRLSKGGRGSHFQDRKSTRLNSSHLVISYAVFCLKQKRVALEQLRRQEVQERRVYGELGVRQRGDVERVLHRGRRYLVLPHVPGTLLTFLGTCRRT